MKKYRIRKETIVTKEACVHMTCDLCKRKAEYPTDEMFEWGGAGMGVGRLEWHHSIDGEHAPKDRELCYECAEALARAFERNTHELLILIGRETGPAPK